MLDPALCSQSLEQQAVWHRGMPPTCDTWQKLRSDFMMEKVVLESSPAPGKECHRQSRGGWVLQEINS